MSLSKSFEGVMDKRDLLLDIPMVKLSIPMRGRRNLTIRKTSSAGGYYGVCVDNQFSRFASKLVNIYITTFRYDEWEKYTKELESLDISVQNFTGMISGVDQRIGSVLQLLHKSRSHESRDAAMLEDSLSYVSFWSVMQCLVIMATSSVQVYFVRKLFEVQTGKVRA